jgi:hypothetical protein
MSTCCSQGYSNTSSHRTVGTGTFMYTVYSRDSKLGTLWFVFLSRIIENQNSGFATQ